jgi:hypothetical protein
MMLLEPIQRRSPDCLPAVPHAATLAIQSTVSRPLGLTSTDWSMILLGASKNVKHLGHGLALESVDEPGKAARDRTDWRGQKGNEGPSDDWRGEKANEGSISDRRGIGRNRRPSDDWRDFAGNRGRIDNGSEKTPRLLEARPFEEPPRLLNVPPIAELHKKSIAGCGIKQVVHVPAGHKFADAPC